MNASKVALISDEFPFGGIGSVCYDLAYSLSKKRVSTTVFTRARPGTREINIRKQNAYLEIIQLPSLDIPPRCFWFQLQNFNVLSRVLKHYEILHVVSPGSGTFCAYLKRRLCKPLVTSVHGVMFQDLKVFANSPISSWTIGDFGFNVLEYPIYHFLDGMTLRNSDHVIACSFSVFEETKRVYGDFCSRTSSVIYNGINFDKINGYIKHKRPNSLEDRNSPTVVYCGRLFWRKGVIYLLSAFTNLQKDFPDIKLEVFGDGPLMSKMKKKVSNSSLKENVHLHGHVPYARLINEIKEADIVVLPSLYEAQPIAALEAMALKKPVVVFDLPFAREYITNMRTGVLAKAEDTKDLSNSMRMLLLDRKLRVKLGRNAYEYVRKNHNWDTLVEKYIEIYETLL